MICACRTRLDDPTWRYCPGCGTPLTELDQLRIGHELQLSLEGRCSCRPDVMARLRLAQDINQPIEDIPLKDLIKDALRPRL